MHFKQKVQNMTAKEIILAMVEGLRNPNTDRVHMGTFGMLYRNNGKIVCVGCAATNTIANINGSLALDKTYIKHEAFSWDYEEMGMNHFFLSTFEQAINNLRMGNVSNYNIMANIIKIARIYEPLHMRLPYINTDNYQDTEVLEEYIKLANLQK